MKKPKISIVTAYFNRKTLFLKTLESIENSKHKYDIELIVVDDASREEERLENIVDNYTFPINLIRLEEKDKWYKNPCIPFNIGFKEATSDIILIQNPECYHVGDVIDYAISNIDDTKYIAFAAYALDKQQTEDFENGKLPSFGKEISKQADKEGWYNHSQYNPRPLHFTTCITKKNMYELEGFDEKYANGTGFDDDEFLYRIRTKGLEIAICDSPFVFHQNHYNPSTLVSDIDPANNNYNLFFEHTYGKPKIVAFSQLHNELEQGNLENWFKSVEFCDEIYIFDQASTDGSKEYYKKFDNVHVIYSSTNRFEEELICKQELLDKLLLEQPDCDWIFWLDGDTLLDERLSDRNALNNLLPKLYHEGVDGLTLGHYNLWRSDTWHRVDNGYDYFLKKGRIAFWRNNGRLHFPKKIGLHNPQSPKGINNVARIDCNLIHRGFATDESIIHKYNLYKGKGQSGWALDRLLDESTLTTEQIPNGQIPTWFTIKDTQDPREKAKIKNYYEKKY